jgi:hypothetical protein
VERFFVIEQRIERPSIITPESFGAGLPTIPHPEVSFAEMPGSTMFRGSYRCERMKDAESFVAWRYIGSDVAAASKAESLGSR